MRQFTIYAPDEQAGFGPAYVVAFTHDGPVTYAVNDDWQEAADELQQKLNGRFTEKQPHRPEPPRRGRLNN